MLTGDGWRATVRLRPMRERGRIELGDVEYAVVKHGIASGKWTLEGAGGILLTARKHNPFTRRFGIVGAGVQADLRAPSVVSRRMELTGGGVHCRIRPQHGFTRRATIVGDCADVPLVCFAFWLTVLTWRRAANTAASS